MQPKSVFPSVQVSIAHAVYEAACGHFQNAHTGQALSPVGRGFVHLWTTASQEYTISGDDWQYQN